MREGIYHRKPINWETLTLTVLQTGFYIQEISHQHPRCPQSPVPTYTNTFGTCQICPQMLQISPVSSFLSMLHLWWASILLQSPFCWCWICCFLCLVHLSSSSSSLTANSSSFKYHPEMFSLSIPAPTLGGFPIAVPLFLVSLVPCFLLS